MENPGRVCIQLNSMCATTRFDFLFERVLPEVFKGAGRDIPEFRVSFSEKMV
jgi:hypothetical protein